MSGFEGLLSGRVLSERYRIEEVIGRGGMGAVYRALDERLGRAVAVKVITVNAGDAAARERLRARFRHEAALAAKLPHHPNVVPVYDYGTDPALGLDFLVMELLRGEDLASRLGAAGPPPLGTALRILQQAARGVAVGHRSGLIHRDVKPGNIFLVESGHGDEMQVRVLDFGIAKAVAEEDTFTQLTQDGRAPHSPAFASPEQLRGEARLTPASDVFSLGAVGFQLLGGDRPFTEADRNRMGAGMDVPVPSLRARNAAVPEVVEAIVRRCLDPDPAARFADAGALSDALQRVITSLGDSPVLEAVPGAAGAALPTDPDDRTMIAPPPPPVDRAPRPPVRDAEPRPGAGPAIPPPRRRREPESSGGGGKLVWGLLVVALLGAGGVLAMQALGDRDAPDRPLADLADSVVVDTAQLGPDATDALAQDLEGRRVLNAGDVPAAVEYFRRAVELMPDRADFRDHLAVALMRAGQVEQAARELETAIRLEPNRDYLYSHLAEARLQRGDTVGAVVALRRFLEISVNDADRGVARRLLERLEAHPPEIVPVGPSDTIDLTPVAPTPTPAPAPTSDPQAPPADAPRDTIRMGPPDRR